MQSWIFFIFLAQTVWSFTTVLDKYLISKKFITSPLVYIQFNAIMNVLVFAVIPFIDFQFLSPKIFWIALAANVGLAASVALYYKAVQYEEISRITIFFQTIPVLVFVMSYFFIGERLETMQLFGFGLLLLAGILVVIHKTNSKFTVNVAYFYLLMASILSAASSVAVKYVLSVTPIWTAIAWFRIMGFAPLALLLMPSVRKLFLQNISQAPKSVRTLICSKMVVDFSAFFLADFGILLGPISLTSALSSSLLPLEVFILTLFLSAFFPTILKEDFHKKTILTKILALLMVMIGIFLVSK